MVGVLIIVALAILLPVALLVQRFRAGDEPIAGGSWGWQYFRRKNDDWGPKSDSAA
jgi:hypothetical protein